MANVYVSPIWEGAELEKPCGIAGSTAAASAAGVSKQVSRVALPRATWSSANLAAIGLKASTSNNNKFPVSAGNRQIPVSRQKVQTCYASTSQLSQSPPQTLV